MKKTILFVAALTFVAADALAQAQLPTIMVRPGETWCAQNNLMIVSDNQGQRTITPDYQLALYDQKMLQSITEIEALLKDEGFKTVNMRTAMASISDFAAEEMVMTDEYGNSVAKSTVDIMRERPLADIYLDINWVVETVGPKKQLSYTLEGKDYYTGDDVCSVTGIGEPSMSATESVLLREAVIGKIPEMKDRLANYLQDILQNGRSVYVAVRVSDGSNVSLSSTVEGGNLGRVIYKWILRNAVSNRAEASRSSATMASYTVKIPLYDTDGLPMSTEDFVWQLNGYLGAAPYNVRSTVQNQGLGRATLFIQGK